MTTCPVGNRHSWDSNPVRHPSQVPSCQAVTYRNTAGPPLTTGHSQRSLPSPAAPWSSTPFPPRGLRKRNPGPAMKNTRGEQREAGCSQQTQHVPSGEARDLRSRARPRPALTENCKPAHCSRERKRGRSKTRSYSQPVRTRSRLAQSIT